jgi:hypothetical protein
MKGLLAFLGVLGLVASIGLGEDWYYRKYICDRDNFNDTVSPLLNYGRKANGRLAKDRQETTLYCDWSESQLMDLQALLQSQPTFPPYWPQVHLAVTGVTWEGANPANVVWFGAFSSGNDWNANEGCDNTGPLAQVGACHLYADDADGAAIPWTLPDTVPVADFWQLPELTNSVPIVGFVPSTGPADVHTMMAAVDAAVLDKLINDPTCRGLRFWSEQWNNHQVYARGQWGCPGPAAAALIVIPEPATMLLLTAGAAALIARKRR